MWTLINTSNLSVDLYSGRPAGEQVSRLSVCLAGWLGTRHASSGSTFSAPGLSWFRQRRKTALINVEDQTCRLAACWSFGPLRRCSPVQLHLYLDVKQTAITCGNLWLTKQSKAVPLHAMVALWRRGDITPTHSLPRHQIGWMVSVTPRPRFAPGKGPPVLITQ
jgi:hypothetical protein